MMKRIYNIDENVSWLPDLGNLGKYEKTIGTILPEGFNYHYRLEEVFYEDGISYVKTLVKENNIFCYRSISGSGGIFDENDNYVEVLCICVRDEFKNCIEAFNNYRHPETWFFDTIWSENKSIFFYLSPDTTNIYLGSIYEITQEMIGPKNKLCKIKREDPFLSIF